MESKGVFYCCPFKTESGSKLVLVGIVFDVHYSGDILAAAESTYDLLRKLVKQAEFRDTSGDILVIFSLFFNASVS
ncbi:hypothetical protein MKW92_019907 [Papaver armeniacum]|nr:hypothetical protein MKW92_019907 [Papaver armeniacum]